MAEESGQNESLIEVKQRIAHSRDWLARDLEGLRYELDFPLKIRKSFQRHAVLWVSAAVVVGFVLVILPARKKTVYVKTKSGDSSEKKLFETGLLLGAVKIATTLVRPLVVRLVAEKMRSYASRPRAPRRW